jgi:hypothetical protein
MKDRDQRIREIAYYLWEHEGCPEDQAERHWSAAVAVVGPQDAEAENMEGDPRGAAFKEPPNSAPLEASSAPPPPPRASVGEGRRAAASR